MKLYIMIQEENRVFIAARSTDGAEILRELEPGDRFLDFTYEDLLRHGSRVIEIGHPG